MVIWIKRKSRICAVVTHSLPALSCLHLSLPLCLRAWLPAWLASHLPACLPDCLPACLSRTCLAACLPACLPAGLPVQFCSGSWQPQQHLLCHRFWHLPSLPLLIWRGAAAQRDSRFQGLHCLCIPTRAYAHGEDDGKVRGGACWCCRVGKFPSAKSNRFSVSLPCSHTQAITHKCPLISFSRPFF